MKTINALMTAFVMIALLAGCVDKERAEKAEREVDQLKAELQSLREENRVLTEEAKAQEEEVDRLKTELQNLEEEKQSLTEEAKTQQEEQQKRQREKREAKAFALSIVNLYFSEDCDAFLKLVSTPLYSLEDDEAIEITDELKKKICESIAKAAKDGYSYEDYLLAYKAQIFNKSIALAKYPRLQRLKNFKITEQDYLFMGRELKRGNDDFIWDDMFVFMVRKTPQGWKILALSG